ncbi:hypothetical protein BsWGS_07176 [Bradybaena similaris]
MFIDVSPRRPQQPRLRISYTIFLCMFPAVLAVSNFYKQKNAAYDNGAYGKTCYNFTEYKPKCGWKTIIKSPVPLISITFSDQSVENVDNYTFITTNGENNKDLTGRTSTFCSDFHFTGTFGNSGPSLFITWYCICDASTSGICKIVYPEDATSTASSSTLQTTQSDLPSMTQSDTTTIPTITTPLLQPNIASAVFNNDLTVSNIITAMSTIAPSVPTSISTTAPPVPASMLVTGIPLSLFPSLTTNDGLGSGVPTAINPTTLTTIPLSTHSTFTEISAITGNIASATRGITYYEFPFSQLSMTKNSLNSAWEMPGTSTATISKAEASTEILPTFLHVISNTFSITAKITTTRLSLSDAMSTIISSETSDATNDPTMVTSDPSVMSIFQSAWLWTHQLSKSSITTIYTSSELFASATAATRESRTDSPALPLSTETLGTVSIATVPAAEASMAVASAATDSLAFTTAYKLWFTNTTFPEHTATTDVDLFKSLPASPVATEDSTITNTKVPLFTVLSPALTLANTTVIPETTSTAVLSDSTVSSSVLGTHEASSTTLPLLSTTSKTPAGGDVPWSIYLQKIPNACYTGQNYFTLARVTHVIDCASRCIRDITCNGINFSKATKQCDLVDDEKTSSTWQISPSVGCSFWEMVWKQ